MATGRVIGVDLGGAKLLAGAVDPALSVHHRAGRPAPAADEGALLDTVVSAVGEVRDAIEGTSGRVDAVGVAIPGLIDTDGCSVVVSSLLPRAGVALGDLLAERIGLPVFADNDGNAAMLAEWRFGAARGARDAVLLTVGAGVGGGLVAGGALQRGSHGAGAELGHMVVQADGPPCNGACPNRGCLESLCSATALARDARRLARERPGTGLGRALAAGREISGPLVTELAHDGDEAAIAALAQIGRWLGLGVANLVNMLDPEVVIIGGDLVAAGELLLAPARAVVAERALWPSREHVRIVPARFGAESGMLGAAVLALDGMDSPGRPDVL